MSGDAAVVSVGDKIVLTLPVEGSESEGQTQRVKAVVQSVKKSKTVKNGTAWKYRLLLESGEERDTRLVNMQWKLVKSAAPASEESSEAPKSKKRKTSQEDAAPAQVTTPAVPVDIGNGLTHLTPVPRTIKRKTKRDLLFKREALNHIVAPMVGASELAFRLLCRKYGATLAYTPMINSEKFAVDPQYRYEQLQTNEADAPLVAHFSANDPEVFLVAAKLAQPYCDAIDLNLGCPQRVAHAGHFGSYLLGDEDRPTVLAMVRRLSAELEVPLFVKIRLLDTLEDTIKLCKELYDAGASLIAIHGRQRVNLVGRTGAGARTGAANLEWIRDIRASLPADFPVITNGNVRTYDDIVANRATTNTDGVMVAEALLDNPALFNGGTFVPKLQLASEYIALAEAHGPVAQKTVVFHLRRMAKSMLEKYQCLEEMIRSETLAASKEIIERIKRYETQGGFEYDKEKAAKDKEAEARRKAEESKRKDFEARMVRKAKREGKDLNYYLLIGAEVPTTEIIAELRSMSKDDAFNIWKDRHGQHCWSHHFLEGGCPRDRKCSFLHADTTLAEGEVYG